MFMSLCSSSAEVLQ